MGRRVPAIIPITDLRKDAAEVLGKVRSSREPIVITQRGRASAVLLGVDEYERTLYERDLLRALVKGDREIEEGDGFDLASVMRDADRLLGDEP